MDTQYSLKDRLKEPTSAIGLLVLAATQIGGAHLSADSIQQILATFQDIAATALIFLPENRTVKTIAAGLTEAKDPAPDIAALASRLSALEGMLVGPMGGTAQVSAPPISPATAAAAQAIGQNNPVIPQQPQLIQGASNVGPQ